MFIGVIESKLTLQCFVPGSAISLRPKLLRQSQCLAESQSHKCRPPYSRSKRSSSVPTGYWLVNTQRKNCAPISSNGRDSRSIPSSCSERSAEGSLFLRHQFIRAKNASNKGLLTEMVDRRHGLQRQGLTLQREMQKRPARPYLLKSSFVSTVFFFQYGQLEKWRWIITVVVSLHHRRVEVSWQFEASSSLCTAKRCLLSLDWFTVE